MARRSSTFLNSKQIFLLGLLAALALGVYIALSASHSGLGFPLDDAWIHQTYARNLALGGEWAFNPGEPSAGATSPLWVLLLAPGYWIGAAPFVWTFLLGWLTLWAIGWLAAVAFAQLAPKQVRFAQWVGALLILEYHLVWAAASGMETALFAALCLGAVVAGLKEKSSPWLPGLLIGAAAWIRPEGITLLAPLVIGIWTRKEKNRKESLIGLFGGFLVLFLPYLAFNRAISGAWWPNTFYAKQAEYATLLQQPIWSRLAQLWVLPLIGVGLFLLPGFIAKINFDFKTKTWAHLAWAVWVLGFPALFALRLPVTYQHGRYAMPVIPIFVVLATAGLAAALSGERKRTKLQRRLGLAWSSAVGMAAIAFYALGAQAYWHDVEFINTEMVTTAKWIEANTETDALIGAHDIGALGYFSKRRILDMAGLVSPEVIPFLRNEARLADELYAWGADYLVTFPGWYPLLSSQAELLHQTDGSGPSQGGENMAVYRWYSLGE